MPAVLGFMPMYVYMRRHLALLEHVVVVIIITISGFH